MTPRKQGTSNKAAQKRSRRQHKGGSKAAKNVTKQLPPARR
jgi:hypothetical protein